MPSLVHDRDSDTVFQPATSLCRARTRRHTSSSLASSRNPRPTRRHAQHLDAPSPWLPSTARSSAVLPALVRGAKSAPFSTSSWHAAARPASAARISGVQPAASLAFKPGAWAASSNRAASTWPYWDARCNGVEPTCLHATKSTPMRVHTAWRGTRQVGGVTTQEASVAASERGAGDGTRGCPVLHDGPLPPSRTSSVRWDWRPREAALAHIQEETPSAQNKAR